MIAVRPIHNIEMNCYMNT